MGKGYTDMSCKQKSEEKTSQGDHASNPTQPYLHLTDRTRGGQDERRQIGNRIEPSTIRAYLAHDTLPCRKYGNPGNSSKTQNTFVDKGYKGMSRQTKLNRRARSGGTHLKQLITRIPRTEVKNNIDEYITQIWKRKWENEPHY